jgi:16S rRNA (cytosine967-C5)-methyltransferase
MRLPPAIIASTEEALRDVLRFTAAADMVLSRYFREHPRLGGRERGVIAEAVYALLRKRTLFTHLAESGSGSQMRRIALLGLAHAVGVESIAGLSEQEIAWLTEVLALDSRSFSVALRTNMPDWIMSRLIAQLGEEEAFQLVDALNESAPLDLRINTIKSSVDAVQTELTTAGIVSEPTPYSPLGLRIRKKPALQNMPIFKDGWVEVQDEGSQLLAQIVGAKRGEMVADFCAGAGGKTLALGAWMRNTGRLYAFDVVEKRLAKLKPRLARSGLSNVHPGLMAHEKDAKIKRLSGKLDRVLIDAPCSGLGTLRRNPDMKWRQSENDIAQMSQLQTSILASAARLVKPGGRVVYATCSLLEEENEAIVTNFLSTHPDYELRPMSEVLAEQKIPLVMDDYLKLLPHRHHTDGFFAAVIERKA